LIVTVVFPLFVSVTVCELLVATATFPKLKLPGFATSVLPLPSALPVRLIVCGELPALPVKTMLPVAPVVDAGVN
jgi:hypothetical protein